MTIEQLAGLIKDFVLASIMFFLYWNERSDRRDAVQGQLAQANATIASMTEALKATAEALKAVAGVRNVDMSAYQQMDVKNGQN